MKFSREQDAGVLCPPPALRALGTSEASQQLDHCMSKGAKQEPWALARRKQCV